MQEKTFKYGETIKNEHNCPPIFYKEQSQFAFRYVHEKALSQSLIPLSLIDPNRILNMSSESRCMAWGLSFYSSIEGARAKFQKLSRYSPQFAEIVGKHIATIRIDEIDGVASVPDEKFGHFTFHEYLCSELLNNITQIEPIET
jgi:hypothetical protein